MFLCLYIVSGFLATELSSFQRFYDPTNPKIFAIWPFTEKVLCVEYIHEAEIHSYRKQWKKHFTDFYDKVSRVYY
jgi:hypothetical protein